MTNSGPMSNYVPPTYQVPTGAFGASAPVVPGVGGSKNIPTVAGLLNALKRRWLIACVIGSIVGAGIGIGVWLAMPAGKHQAKASVHMQQAGLMNNSEEAFRRWKEAQIVTIKSKRLLNRVASLPEVRTLSLIENADDPSQVLENLIHVKWMSGAEDFLVITLNGDKPEELRVILDKLHRLLEQLQGPHAIARRRMLHLAAAAMAAPLELARDHEPLMLHLEVALRHVGHHPPVVRMPREHRLAVGVDLVNLIELLVARARPAEVRQQVLDRHAVGLQRQLAKLLQRVLVVSVLHQFLGLLAIRRPRRHGREGKNHQQSGQGELGQKRHDFAS
jgi:hypothetical protein